MVLENGDVSDSLNTCFIIYDTQHVRPSGLGGGGLIGRVFHSTQPHVMQGHASLGGSLVIIHLSIPIPRPISAASRTLIVTTTATTPLSLLLPPPLGEAGRSALGCDVGVPSFVCNSTRAGAEEISHSDGQCAGASVCIAPSAS